jgi:hypothetical protein
LLRLALKPPSSRHRRQPTALAHEHSAKEAFEPGCGGNGLVEVFHLIPVVHVMEQDTVGVAAGQRRKATTAGMNDLHRPGALHAQGVLNHVRRVRMEPGYRSCAEALGKTPRHHARRRVDVIERMVRLPRSRSQPQVPIQSVGHSLRRQIEIHRYIGADDVFDVDHFGVGPETSGDPCQVLPQRENRLDSAEPAGPDEFADGSYGGDRAVLGAGLEHPPISADRLDHLASFPDGYRNGFFAVDVFAGLCRVDRLQRVPVVGRGDHDGVDVGSKEQLAVIVVRCAAFVRAAGAPLGIAFFHAALGVLSPQAIDIANGQDLNRRIACQPR